MKPSVAYFFSAPVFWGLLLSCSSLNSKDGALVAPKFESQLLLYKSALELTKQNPELSCESFKKLSESIDFPLRDLAQIRSQMLCPLSEIKSPRLKEPQDEWLSFLKLERDWALAEKTEDPIQKAKILHKKSMNSDRMREKVQFLIAAQGFLLPLCEEKENAKCPTELFDEVHSRLYQFAPRLKPDIKPEDYFSVGNDLIFNREFESGRSYFKKIYNDKARSLEERYKAFKAYRNSYKTEQKRDDHLVAAERFARWTQKYSSPQRQYEALMLWARALWTENQFSRAVKVLDEVEKKLKGKVSLEELYFVRGKMQDERENYEKAIEFYSLAEKENKRPSTARSRVLFSKSWNLRKLKKYSDAVTSFETLKSETSDPFELNKISFWLGRTYKDAGQKEKSEKEFQELIKMDPLGFYGLMAHRELNLNLPQIQPAAGTRGLKTPSSIPDQESDFLKALIFVGESQVLERFLNTKTKDLQKRKNPSQEEWLFYLKAYTRAGLYLPLFAQLGALPAELRTQILEKDPELLFPRKFSDLIQAQALRFQVRPELIMSIIRQESAFNPFARSPADALGLMQILPSVAERFQKETGLTLQHFEDLYKPEVNVALGAALLSHLQKRYDGQFILTAAAYNASEKAIEGWLQTRLKEDPLEFIEDIPYEETKGYVKMVLRNFMFYIRLSQPQKEMPFPEWTLEGLNKVAARAAPSLNQVSE